MHRTLVLAAVVATLSACSSTPEKAPAAPAPAASPAPATPVPVAPPETEAVRFERILNALAAKSVYFDYDDYTVKAEYQSLLKEDYELLKSEPKLAIRLEGNADERGSREYNLALGQKRAEAVRRALVLLGIPEAQIEAVSYGKERPRALCHDEKCWSQNRRVDFAHKAGALK
ncbi:MAG TPA: peptidoglycan-associated lipoprotein Pal [Rhodocyclaceae bacterium]|nr:peptidoglycan-associated lipoprotein Pal [Rhodocyclaceae bacterium]